MRTLFITPGIENADFGGPKGSIRNYEALKKYGEVDVYTFSRKSSMRSLISLVKGYYPPIDSSDYKHLESMYRLNKYDLVFFDTSIYGRIVDIFSNSLKVVFCHNCEFDYNKSVRFGLNNTLKKRLYLKAINTNEGYLLRQADYRITFLKRDANRIKELYGVDTDLIVPLGIKDTVSCNYDKSKEGEYCLLFGAYGSANVEGYKWFVENVSAKLNCRTVVAGKGFEKYKNDWSSNKVDVFGYVDNMDKLYENARAVCVPLFSGGGMKVKVVEALMYGKHVFGTDEALAGFTTEGKTFLHRCNTGDEYVLAVNSFIESNMDGYCIEARGEYEKKYSISGTGELFERMISELKLCERGY